MTITDFVSRMFGENAGRSAEHVGDDNHGDALDERAPPFVLVAHDIEGRWDVYAKRFDTPLASFDQRQPACNYASRLARMRKDGLVLMRDTTRPRRPTHAIPLRALSGMAL